MRIFDLHTHVIPCVDDGADSSKTALEMLENAADSHVEVLVATPHCNLPGWYENYKTSELINKFQTLKADAESADIPLSLLLGSEVHATWDLLRLLNEGKILTLNDSRYLLTEFPVDAASDFYSEMLKKLLALGYVPLIAHPERYMAVWETPEIVMKWLDWGCHLQLTAGSVLGEFGRKVKKTSDFLLKEDLVACIASDAHDARTRTNFLGNMYTHLCLNYSQEYAMTLLWDNPLRICRNEAL